MHDSLRRRIRNCCDRRHCGEREQCCLEESANHIDTLSGKKAWEAIKDNANCAAVTTISLSWSRQMDSGRDRAGTVRQAVYRAVAASGGIPSVDEVAEATALAPDAVVDALRALAEAHVIVLEADRRAIRFAPPFSAVDTAFPVRAAGHRYFAPCAWDAFGIPAALRADADVDATCAESGIPVACGIRGGVVYGDGIIHLLVPAARFWDDIVYT
jgi:hypothetical protein